MFTKKQSQQTDTKCSKKFQEEGVNWKCSKQKKHACVYVSFGTCACVYNVYIFRCVNQSEEGDNGNMPDREDDLFQANKGTHATVVMLMMMIGDREKKDDDDVMM